MRPDPLFSQRPSRIQRLGERKKAGVIGTSVSPVFHRYEVWIVTSDLAPAIEEADH